MKIKLTSVFIAIVCFIIAFSLSACSGGEDEVAVFSLRLDKTTLSLLKGESSKLTAIVSPENATNPTVNWSTSDPAVATVDATGYVTAVAAGSASITARSVSDEKYAATCSVIVTVAVESISLDKQEIRLVKGQTALLNAIITPSDATTKDVFGQLATTKLLLLRMVM